MMTNRSSERSLRWKQLLAAWKTVWTRPLSLCIVLALLPLLLSVNSSDTQSPDRVASRPGSWGGFGKRMWDPKEFCRFYDSGLSDDSVMELRLLGAGGPSESGKSVMLLSRPREGNGDSRSGTAVSITHEETNRLIRQFPATRRIELSGELLCEITAETFDALPDLTSIRLQVPEVTSVHLQCLAKASTLRSLELSTASCGGGLSELKHLPHLHSIQLTAFRGTLPSGRSFVTSLSMAALAELQQLPKLSELAIESDTLLTETTLAGNELTDRELIRLDDVAAVLAKIPALKAVYVGGQETKARRNAIRHLHCELPGVSVNAAWYGRRKSIAMAVSWGCGGAAFFLIVFHLIGCCSLPQSHLLPRNGSSHSFVAAGLLFGVALCQALFLVTNAGVACLAAVAVVVFEIAVATILSRLLVISKRGPIAILGGIRRPQALFLPLLVFGVLVVVFVPDAGGVRLEWFLYGEQPIIAGGLTLTSLLIVFGWLVYVTATQRRWAEGGRSPAMTLAEIHGVFQRRAARSLAAPAARPKARLWSVRVARLVESLGGGQLSFRKRLRLWHLGVGPSNAVNVVAGSFMIYAFVVFSPAALAYFRGEEVSGGEPFLAAVTGANLVFGMLVNFGSGMNSRFSMFPSELLRPVSREQWVDDTLNFMTVTLLLGAVWSVLLMHGVGIFGGFPASLLWCIASGITAVAFALLSSGVIAMAIIKRRLVFTVFSIVAVVCGGFLVLVTFLNGWKLTVMFPVHAQPLVCIAAATAELFLAICLLKLARRRWLSAELALESA